MEDWTGPDGPLGGYVTEEVRKTLSSYREQPNLVAEHASHERATADGGYAHRQIVELAQNSADSCSDLGGRGRIYIRLTGDHLYCADSGSPLDEDGITALMFSNLSPKRGLNLIGRFGLGFKSVLGVTDAPEFFSRSVSLRFDGDGSERRIRAGGIDADQYPKLRTPDPIDPHECAASDDTLREFMAWATNVVRLPLQHGASDRLSEQLREFPTQFLLFVEQVGHLSLRDDITDASREVQVDVVGGEHRLTEGDTRVPWRVFSVPITSPRTRLPTGTLIAMLLKYPSGGQRPSSASGSPGSSGRSSPRRPRASSRAFSMRPGRPTATARTCSRAPTTTNSLEWLRSSSPRTSLL